MKENLEDKILHKVYSYEKKRTGFLILKYALLIGSGSILIIFVTAQILIILAQQETLSVLDIFHEDVAIIQTYFAEVVNTLYEESPNDLFLTLFTGIVFLSVVLFLCIKNYPKIQRKTKVLLGSKKRI